MKYKFYIIGDEIHYLTKKQPITTSFLISFITNTDSCNFKINYINVESVKNSFYYNSKFVFESKDDAIKKVETLKKIANYDKNFTNRIISCPAIFEITVNVKIEKIYAIISSVFMYSNPGYFNNSFKLQKIEKYSRYPLTIGDKINFNKLLKENNIVKKNFNKKLTTVKNQDKMLWLYFGNSYGGTKSVNGEKINNLSEDSLKNICEFIDNKIKPKPLNYNTYDNYSCTIC